ncbi:MAG: phospho-sugar mutase [Planctomycetia bacterium]|nr:phospho-sugar mutase [Planctomycetia bacterium]
MDKSEALCALQHAVEERLLTPSALKNIELWLNAPQYAPYVDEILNLVQSQSWKELDDAFWTIIPFGTGGRRGRMYPVGTNVINDVTIGESAQGLASYTLEYLEKEGISRRPSCAIAYDTRHRSRHFAELCAGIMVANGFKVWFLDGFRSTPEMSFMVRYKECDCGIMVTASHNPPSDNAVKVYWNTGGQALFPHDEGIIRKVMSLESVRKVSFDDALKSGDIEYCQDEVDQAFIDAVLKISLPGSRDLHVVYSPLHGVGASCVLPVLEKAGFENVELFGPHAEPSGDFPNVPNHVSNPENPAVFDMIIDYARQKGGIDLILATDPDSDRLGVAAPLSFEEGSVWKTITGNQIAALMAEYLLSARKAAGTLSPENYVVETLVTTPLVKRIGDAYGVRTINDLLVGFKFIGGAIEENGPENFVFGAEESYGFLIGAHARDKDAAAAALTMCELAAAAKSQRKTIHDKLEEIYAKYGRHDEKAFSLVMTGSEGTAKMSALLERFQKNPPKSVGGMEVVRIRDYEHATQTDVLSGKQTPLVGPRGKLVVWELSEPGNFIAARPSGTEPKIKFYLFAALPPGVEGNLDDHLARVENDLRALI